MPSVSPAAQSGRTFAELGDIDPYSDYERWRAVAPIVWDDSARAWLVTGYDICRHVEIDEAAFRHPYADASETLIDIKGGRRNVTILRGEEHFAMHRFLLGLFAPKQIGAYRAQHIAPILSHLVEAFLPAGKGDLVQGFAAQAPPRVLMSLFAMDWRNDELANRVLSLHDDVLAWIGQQNRGDSATAKARHAASEINAILMPYLAARKVDPGQDLISRVWLEGPSALANFSDADALATTREMFLAGTDTTVHALANAFYILLTQPQVMERVRAERGPALNALVEEALRLYGSVQYRFRISNHDTMLGGIRIKKNDALILINAAANRDPTHYKCPGDVDLDRNRPADHLAFNVGPRTCVGAALARAEMADAISALLDRTRNLRLDPDAPPPEFKSHYIRSFRPLNVLFDAV